MMTGIKNNNIEGFLKELSELTQKIWVGNMWLWLLWKSLD